MWGKSRQRQLLKVQVPELEQKRVAMKTGRLGGPGLGLVLGMDHSAAWLDSPVCTSMGQHVGWMWRVPHDRVRNLAEQGGVTPLSHFKLW